MPAYERDGARGSERQTERRQRDRRTNHAARRISDQSAEAETNRGMFRVAEDHRPDAEGASSGVGESGLGVHVRRGSLQSGANEESDGQFSWCRMSKGRSVPARGQSAENGSQLQALTRLIRALRAGYIEFGIMRVANFVDFGRFSVAC